MQNTIGMFLNVIGTLLIFIFGTPFSFSSPSYGILYKNPSEKELRIKKLSKIMAFIGLCCVLIGFTLQLSDCK